MCYGNCDWPGDVMFSLDNHFLYCLATDFSSRAMKCLAWHGVKEDWLSSPQYLDFNELEIKFRQLYIHDQIKSTLKFSEKFQGVFFYSNAVL